MMQNSYGQRAAAALDELLPRTQRVKTVQRLFDCSARMAAYLLSGDHWTARRLVQASELLGDAFDAAFNQPENAFRRNLAHQDRDARVMRLEHRLDQMDKMDREIQADVARAQIGQTSVGVGGFVPGTKDES